MDFTFNSYAVFLLLCGVLTIFIATYIYKKGGDTVKWLSLIMLANAVWSLGYGLELASSNVDQITFFINIQYLGIATMPFFWFLFSLSFCGKEYWYHRKLNFALLLLFPFLSILVVWTNSYHHWQYKSIDIDHSGPFPMATFVTGFWYYLVVIYFYVLLICGCYLVLKKYTSSEPIFKKQNYSIVISVFIPWIANILYLLGYRPLGHIDSTPFTFLLACILILIGIFKFKLFNIIPFAREKVLDLIQDGFIVLDQQNRVIDYNKSLLRYLDIAKDQKIIGAELHQIMPGHPIFYEAIKNNINGKVELTFLKGEVELFIEIDILFLNENKMINNFCIIKLQDQTASRKDAKIAREQANELEKLNALKDRIFSIISHDLRGPLVNVSEILKMISNNQITNDEFKGLAPILSKDIIYTTDLLENMLHWSRSQLQGFGIKKEFFNLRNLIINEINYHLPAATIKQIKIIHDVFPGEMVYADMLMIQIVIRNLLNNAIKFCNNNCEILITAGYQKDQTMVICIEDNGIGIPPEILAKLFKNENITTRGTSNEKGTGLGLMVCKDFMKKNNGSIRATSKLGEGTKFYITIPTSM